MLPNPSDHTIALRTLGRDAMLGSLVGVFAGLAAALFLALLDVATDTRSAHTWLVFLLPAGGFAMGWCIERFGGPATGGTDVVIAHIAPFHAGTSNPPETRVPWRLAPMVLVGTVLTHLFGGSAGREGTAVQMGASLADGIARLGRAAPAMRRTLTVAGVAGGFGAVFGTPMAGCIFALEFATIGRFHHTALIAAVFASIIGDRVALATGITHTPFPVLAPTPLDAALVGKWLLFALVIAAASVLFIELTDRIRSASRRHLRRLPWRMAVGGVAVVLLWRIVGADTWLGLGVPAIVDAFSGDAETFSFALKILFTALTIGSGFLGGEVTPLFFVGATLGAVLAPVLDIPVSLAAGVGMAATFGAASNTPLALSIMAVELLGAAALPHVALVAVVAWVATGHRGIYAAQRFAITKTGTFLAQPHPLEAFSSDRPRRERDASADAEGPPR
jgi:H+/Cl- antiporter ClcA